MSEQSERSNILALDVGEQRIGVAIARTPIFIPYPLVTINNSDHVADEIQKIITDESIGMLVIGLPRGLDGQETKQTASARQFAKQLTAIISVPITLQDEAATSVKAEAELKASRETYNREMVDSLAAVYILEDFIRERGLVK